MIREQYCNFAKYSVWYGITEGKLRCSVPEFDKPVIADVVG